MPGKKATDINEPLAHTQAKKKLPSADKPLPHTPSADKPTVSTSKRSINNRKPKLKKGNSQKEAKDITEEDEDCSKTQFKPAVCLTEVLGYDLIIHK